MAQGKEDVIEIPLGKYLKAAKHNPWMPASIVLGIICIVLIGLLAGSSGGGIGKEKAAGKLLDFINAQGKGSATLVSVADEKGLYNVKVNYQGQEVPVYVTKDGSSLVPNIIPLIADGNAAPKQGERVQVDKGNSPSKGSKDAPVVIVEFSDFQCPYCEKFFAGALQEIDKNYIATGKALLVYKDFPISNIHPQAEKAAEAAQCVREQLGDVAFFLMHDKLFNNQNSLSVDNYKKWAREIDADGAKFDDCLDSGKYANSIQKDVAYGRSLGVTGTPTFFINGVSLEGAQPYSAFKQVIDAELGAGQ